ncbi:MAG: sugar phosphate isomerase/epimerase family protein [Gemmataceae bacterium]
MLPGYNTNGFAHHRLEDAIVVLAELGYRSVALTLDCHVLNPYAPAGIADEVMRVRSLLAEHGLRCVVETGARFLLDPRRKHQPTLLDTDPQARERRVDFLRRSIQIAQQLGADAVSFWSGQAPPGAAEADLWPRLVEGCRMLCRFAAEQGVRLAFEPEPGMFIDTMPRFATLFEQVAHPAFGLTLDIGHLCCQGEMPATPHLLRWRDVLWNVHLEDMRVGRHDHLMFGEGEIDFAEVFVGLHRADYRHGLHVELSRHSHNAVDIARQSLNWIRPYLN